MTTTIDEIAPDTFRISAFTSELGFSFNQYLVRDEQPLLYHTGFRKAFPATRDTVARLLDPATIRWIGYSHFEPDECGALNEWLAIAPNASPITGIVGSSVVLEDFADRPARVLQDGEILPTGKRSFRFLATPHLPHGWDASLLFEETTHTLFCSDLFMHSGSGPAIVETDIVEPAREMMAASLDSPFAHSLPWTPHTEIMFERLAGLEPQVLAVMHGSAYRGDGSKALLDLCGVAGELASASHRADIS
ncbi:MAG: MBL fold metallo-hydrolase [Mesorhizobium sp.]|nr:MAG: MBL fold metallo-hydrolase [Mesorhizobium sp.]